MSQGTITLIYETPDAGSQQHLPDVTNGIDMTGPVAGLGAPPIDFMTDAMFDQHGEQERIFGHRFKSRDITVPIAMVGSDGGQLLRTQRVLGSNLNPIRGTGKLHVVRSDDPNPRYARCRYLSGLQAAEHSLKDFGDMWATAVLTFHCFDPFFYDKTPNTVSWGPSGSGSAPFFPMFASPTNVGPHFSSSNVFGVQEVSNRGDMGAYPKWTINGPCVNPVITNQTTGDKLDFSSDGGLSMIAGDVLLVDTTPGILAVTLNGISVFSKLSADSQLFHLQLGTNAIMVTAGGVTSSSLIQLSFEQRWLSA